MNTASSETAAALMPEPSKGPRMGKVRLSQLILIAAANYTLPTSIDIRKTQPFGMNEFTWRRRQRRLQNP